MATTTSVLRGGIAINEFLADPNSGTNNFDTDGNGTADADDEFVEIVNTSGAAIDISDLELWDSGQDLWFTFPPATMLGAGNVAIVISNVQAGGALPVVSGGNLAFNAGNGTGALNNGGDNVVLLDRTADEFIQLVYNGDATDNPPVDYAGAGFSATATLVGTVEDFGSDTDGVSLARSPDGDTNVVAHNTIPGLGGQLASPGASGDNTSPVFANLDAMPTYVEADSAAIIDADASVSDAQYDALNGGNGDYNTSTLTISRQGGADPNDVFEASGTLSALTELGALTVGGTDVGVVTQNSGGTLVLTFGTGSTTALVNSVLTQIAYSNPDEQLPVGVSENIVVDISFSDGALTDSQQITLTHTGIDSDDVFAGTALVADVINAGIDNDMVSGLSGDDMLNGEAGDDTINGGRGSDMITGGEGQDLLYGSFGDDELDGGAGNDLLRGNDHSDTLNGGDDDDRLYGGLGDDRLNGGAGDDIMRGDAGADEFVFEAGNEIDRVRGFEDGVDLIDLSSFAFADADAALANAFTQGANVRFIIGGDTMVIENELLSNITSDDLILM